MDSEFSSSPFLCICHIAVLRYQCVPLFHRKIETMTSQHKAVCPFPTVAGTNCHCLNGLKQHDFVMSQFCRSPVWAGLTVSLAWFSKGQNQGVGRLGSYWEVLERICFQAHLGSCQNLAPYSWEPEGPISLLAVSWGRPGAPKGLPLVLAYRPLPAKARQILLAWNLSDSPSAASFLLPAGECS